MSGDREQVDSLTNITEEDQKIIDSESVGKIRRSSFGQGYSPVYRTKVARTEYLTTAFAKNYFINNRWITLIMLANLNEMESNIRNLASENLDVYYLTDSYGEKFSSKGTAEQIENAEERELKTKINDYSSKLGNLTFVRKSSSSQYGIVSNVQLKTLLHSLLPYFLIMLGSMLLFLVIAVILTQRSMNEAIKPIQNLSKHIHGFLCVKRRKM